MEINEMNILNKSRKRKLIERSIIFSVVLIGFTSFAIFDLFFCYVYKIDGFRDLQWFVYWTHLSNTAAFIWISLAFIAVVFEIDHLERWIQHWNIKNTIFTFIIVTGLVFMGVAFIPVAISYSTPGPIMELKETAIQMNENGFIVAGTNSIDILSNRVLEVTTINGDVISTDPSSAYRAMVIIGTTFKHLIIPSLFIYLAFTELGYYRTRELSDRRRTLIQFIWPSMYFVYALTLGASGLVNPPYPVLDYGYSYLFYYNMTTVWSQTLLILGYVLLDITAGMIYVGVSVTQNYINKRAIAKHKEKVETK